MCSKIPASSVKLKYNQIAEIFLVTMSDDAGDLLGVASCCLTSEAIRKARQSHAQTPSPHVVRS